VHAAPSSSEPQRAAQSRGQVLVVDDDGAAADVLVEALRNRKFQAHGVTSAAAATAWLDSGRPCEVVLTDLRMPGTSGIELAQSIVRDHPTVPAIVITAFGSIHAAVEAIRRGAYDFLTKPYDLEVVALALDRAVAHHRLREELDQLRGEPGARGWGNLVGKSPAMERLYRRIERVADGESNVLVVGESGTGKELVARAIHERSPRGTGPFVPVNCAAIPEALLESELFGHARGAFTDARQARTGLMARARGGTLFLDEIGDMPLAMQARLLRALQERVVRPVGADHEVPIDVRVIAATHRDLEAEVAAERFRQDLLFRIQVIEIVLPPLRARGNDVLLLAQELARRTAERTGRPTPALSPAAAEKMLHYDWPGNVRELQNCIERAVALATGPEILPDDLPDRVRASRDAGVLLAADEPDGLVPLEEIERRYVLRVMDAVRGNKKLAAQILGLDRSTLYRKLEQYGLHERKEQ
jgi:two-component system response regulator HydG